MKTITLRRIMTCAFAGIIATTALVASAFAGDEINSLARFQQLNQETQSKAIAEVSSQIELAENNNNTLAKTDLTDIVTTITFSDYITFEEFAKYSEDYELEIAQLQLRGYAADGTRVTMFTKTTKGLAETERLIEELAQHDNTTLTGITSAFAYVDANNLTALTRDELTFLADTTGDAYAPNNASIASIQRNSSLDGAFTAEFPQPMTWQLEDLGVLK